MNKEVKLLIGVITCLLIIVVGSSIYKHYKTTINIEKLCAYLLEQSIYDDMKEIPFDDVDAHYKEVDLDDIVDARVFVAKDGTSREFAVFTATNPECADAISIALALYAKERLAYYEEVSPNPIEVKRIERFKIHLTRNDVIFTISDEYGTGTKLVDDFLREQRYEW